jgi:hypothetical protein
MTVKDGNITLFEVKAESILLANGTNETLAIEENSPFAF